MKNLKKILFFIVGIGLMISCLEDPDWGYLSMKDNYPIIVTLPVDASFSCNYLETFVDLNLCGSSPMMRVLAEGSGTGVSLGDFTIYWDYCCDIETCCFNNSGSIVATLVAANGDELFISSWGIMSLPDESDPPDIIKKWDAPVLFKGGTGLYKGASGEGIFNGQIYNHKDGEPQYGGSFTGILTTIKRD